uniref:Uncharacterized protein n=1 Tax=Globodera rostochiensis TaxID=31243 RepID=A0A914GXQ1_GLORO
MELTKNCNFLPNTDDVNDHDDDDHLNDPIYQNIPCLPSAAEKKPPAPSAAPFSSCRRHHFPPAASTTGAVSAFRESASPRHVQKYDPLFVKCSQSSSSETEHATLPALIAEASTAYALGDLETALRAYQRVLRAEPSNNVLHANISAILLRMDDACKQQALEAADRAIQLMPDWPKAHFRRGEALSALARLDEAVLAHAEAFQLSDGQDEQFRSALIECAALNGANGETFENAFAQHQLEGDDGCDLLNSVAEFFRMSEKPEFALRLLRIAAKMTSNTTAAQLCLKKLTNLEIEMGNWNGGLQAIERQLEIAKTLELFCRRRPPHCSNCSERTERPSFSSSSLSSWSIARN